MPKSSGKIALARLLNKTIKAIIIIIGATFIFYMANLNLTAVITGLGVGGIAVAFRCTEDPGKPVRRGHDHIGSANQGGRFLPRR